MVADPEGRYVLAEDCLPMLDLLSKVLRVMQDALPPDGLTDRAAFTALWMLMDPWPLAVEPLEMPKTVNPEQQVRPCDAGCSGTMRLSGNGYNEWMECDKCRHIPLPKFLRVCAAAAEIGRDGGEAT